MFAGSDLAAASKALSRSFLVYGAFDKTEIASGHLEESEIEAFRESVPSPLSSR